MQVSKENKNCPICGIYVSDNGDCFISYKDNANDKIENSSFYKNDRICKKEKFSPFVFASEDFEDEAKNLSLKEETLLSGNMPLNRLYTFNDIDSYKEFLKLKRSNNTSFIESTSCLENAFLMQNNLRYFSDMSFTQLRRMQVDIETDISTGFSDPKKDRLLAIGIKCGYFSEKEIILDLKEFTNEAEKELLEKFNEIIKQANPDIIEGHNIFNFDLPFLLQRCKKLKVEPKWGRFDEPIKVRSSLINFAEKSIYFKRFDIPGRTVVDTYFLSLLYDISKRVLSSYSLKNVAKHFGISSEETGRTILKANQICEAFRNDRGIFNKYLIEDLCDTKGISDRLLPLYFAQCQIFPFTLQEIILRGSGMKVESLLLEKYLSKKASIPSYNETFQTKGGLSQSYKMGVFKNVLHYDVASLYPSLLLYINQNPKSDYLNEFVNLLKNLTKQRLEYKALAKSEKDETLKQLYEARQAGFKILINSFYGYLSLSVARWSDSSLAAKVTQMGRDLLVSLMAKFEENSCEILEADTDGIYIKTEEFFDKPFVLLEKVSSVMPEGVNLEFSAKYKSMLAYKAKNYALFDGEKIIIKGSALRSRGIEPYLQELSNSMISFLLKGNKSEEENVFNLSRKMIKEISSLKYPVQKLAKTEQITQDIKAYKAATEKGLKPRRASSQAALKLNRPFKSGDKIAYYITKSDSGKKKVPDWQVSNPLELFDLEQNYNPDYYIKKINDFFVKYKDILPKEEVLNVEKNIKDTSSNSPSEDGQMSLF